MDQYIGDENIAQYWSVHGEFHNIILYLTGNKRLIDQMKQIYQYLSKLRKATLVMDKRREQAMKEHKELIEAFEKKDEKLAEKIGRKHTINAKKFIEKEVHLF